MLYWGHGKLRRSELDVALESRARALAGATEHDKEDGWEIELAPDFLVFAEYGFYYSIFAPDGRLLRGGGAQAHTIVSAQVGLREQGDQREFVARSPDGATVVVGASLQGLYAERRELLFLIVVAGLAVSVLGLGGGWWLARRTMAPIADLTATAAGLSASDLTQRLDVARTPRELAPLAETLNDAFDRLQTAFEQQTRFTSDASHELRTPLSVVRTQAELALKKARSLEY